MSDTPATRKDIDDILQVLQGFIQHTDERFTAIDEHFERIDERFESIDDRFTRIDLKLIQMSDRLDAVERDIVDLKSSHDRLLNTIDAFIGRIDRYETEQAARDSQFEKLLVWARKVSEKTGIPLDNL